MEECINKIINADCMDILKKLPDKSIDLILTDPPYEFADKNLSHGGGFYKGENIEHLEEIRNKIGTTFNPNNFLEMILSKMKKVNILIWTNKNLLDKYISFAKDKGLSFDIFIWLKSNPTPAFNSHLLVDKEFCVIIREKGAYFDSSMPYDNYFSYINYPIGTKETKHPTEKPRLIFEKLIKIYSPEGGVVMDCFSGSGTTAIACHRLKRRFICIEKDHEYWVASVKRLEDEQKQYQLF